MATTFKLVRMQHLGSVLDSLDLYGDNENIAVTRWIPSGNGTDTMQLRVKGSDADGLATTKRTIDQKIREVGWYADGSERYGVYLRDQVDGETAGRQALIYQMSGEENTSWHGPIAARNNVLFYNLALERGLWEGTAVKSVSVNNVAVNGGAGSYGTVYGTEPARIASMTLAGSTGTSGINEAWVGFRSSRFGDYTKFQSQWMCGDGDAVSAASGEMTMTPGGSAACDFSVQGDALADRMVIVVDDVTTDYTHQRGEFQVLLRAWCGAGTTCYVQMKDGVKTTTSLTERWNAHKRVKVDSTKAILYNLGTVRFPTSGRGVDSSIGMRSQGILLAAQRTAGSNNLVFNRLLLIPKAEGYVYVKNMSLSTIASAQVYQYAEGRVEGWYVVYGATSTIDTMLEIDPHRYGLPVGAGHLVAAAQRATTAATPHTLTDELDIDLYYYGRWRSMRGDDS